MNRQVIHITTLSCLFCGANLTRLPDDEPHRCIFTNPDDPAEELANLEAWAEREVAKPK